MLYNKIMEKNKLTLKDINAQELADFLNCARSFIYQIRSGARKIPIPHCKVINKEYGIPLADLRPDVYD